MKQTKQKIKKKTEFATTKGKWYENCKIVKLYEKKDGATDQTRLYKRNQFQSCIVRYSEKLLTRNYQFAIQSRNRLLGPLRGNKS